MPDYHTNLDSHLSNSDPDVPAPLLGLLLRLAHQHWAREVDAALATAGFDDIRPPHANVFPFVPEDGIQVGELAELARVRKQTMGAAIEQMEQAGYVERRPDPRDARARLVFLTARGASVRPVAHGAGREVEQTWAAILGRKRLEQLRTLLQDLLDELADSTPTLDA